MTWHPSLLPDQHPVGIGKHLVQRAQAVYVERVVLPSVYLGNVVVMNGRLECREIRPDAGIGVGQPGPLFVFRRCGFPGPDGPDRFIRDR